MTLPDKLTQGTLLTVALLREIERRYDGYLALEQQLAAKQAEIDELMLEYCPNEMTEEQLAEYARHQVPISDEQQAAIDREQK